MLHPRRLSRRKELSTNPTLQSIKLVILKGFVRSRLKVRTVCEITILVKLVLNILQIVAGRIASPYLLKCAWSNYVFYPPASHAITKLLEPKLFCSVGLESSPIRPFCLGIDD